MIATPTAQCIDTIYTFQMIEKYERSAETHPSTGNPLEFRFRCRQCT